MPGIAYIDSSALLKLAFAEHETPALESDLNGRDGIVSSRLTAVECRRALRRETQRGALLTLERLVASVFLMDIGAEIIERAIDMSPDNLRSLDAIQLATALATATPDAVFITYDRRLAEAARANGLTVVQPGL
jgi:uncharacterized protein